MKNAKWLKVAALIGVAGLLAACAGPNSVMNTPSPDGDVAGFWWGLLHGFIVPFAFIISLFNDSVSIYEVHNNGGWYDFGFVLGAGILFGLFEEGGS